MDKACFSLILALIFVSVGSSYADIGDAYRHFYLDFNGHHYNEHRTIDTVCLNAVYGVNTAIWQLIFDARVQNNQWILYADLDALDESSYYLTRTCHSRSLELVNQLEGEQAQTQIQSEACKQLMSIVRIILEEKHAFSHYERGMELSAAALDAGKELGNGCEIVLRPAVQGGNQKEEAQDVEELIFGEENDESDETELYLGEFNMRILANDSENENDDSDDPDDKNNSDNDDNSDWKSPDNGDSDEDASDDKLSGSLSWDVVKGLRIKISKSKNGNDDDYIISFDPSTGEFSVKRSTSDDEDEDAVEEANAEEWNSEEWDNDGPKKELLSWITGFYSNNLQSGNYNHNYDHNSNHDNDNSDDSDDKYHDKSQIITF